MNADQLGVLRLLAPVLEHVRKLRFRCLSCEAKAGDRRAVVVWEVPAGRYPYLLMRRAVSPPERERFIILPFELERWQGHLLHAIAPESNGYWLALSPMHVQELQSADCPIRPLLELEDAT